jgi:hypothetical protein
MIQERFIELSLWQKGSWQMCADEINGIEIKLSVTATDYCDSCLDIRAGPIGIDMTRGEIGSIPRLMRMDSDESG